MYSSLSSMSTNSYQRHVLAVVFCIIGIVVVCTSNAMGMSDEDIIAKATTLLSTPESRLQQEEDMRDYVKFASVAAMSSYDKETLDCAEWLKEWLIERLGMHDAGLYKSGYRHPVVVASSGPSDTTKPAVIIYGTGYLFLLQ